MAKITREPQKIFGGSLAPTNNIAVFGSLKAGSPSYSGDPSTIQSSAYDLGWADAVVLNQAPALQDVNALHYVETYQLGYLLQTGIPEWDAATTYYIGSLCNNGSGGIYKSIVDTNLNNALTDDTKWVRWLGMAPTSVTTTATAKTTDMWLVATGTSSYTITLPVISSIYAGKMLYITNNTTSTAVLTVAAGAAQTIDSLSSVVVARNETLILVVNTSGNGWTRIRTNVPDGMVVASTGNGSGSTNTAIRNFGTLTTTGSSITGALSATLGASFTINEAGVYAITYSDNSVVSTSTMGISLNSSQLSTGITGITPADAIGFIQIPSGGGTFMTVSVAGIRLDVGDVIRAHNDSPVPTGVTAYTKLRITQLSKT